MTRGLLGKIKPVFYISPDSVGTAAPHAADAVQFLDYGDTPHRTASRWRNPTLTRLPAFENEQSDRPRRAAVDESRLRSGRLPAGSGADISIEARLPWAAVWWRLV